MLPGGRSYVPHFDETRDERLREFHEENAMPVVGLWEAGFLREEDSRVELRAGRRRRGLHSSSSNRLKVRISG